jgi:urocanate hydratase
MRHADAGYPQAVEHAQACGLNLPMLDADGSTS